MPTPQRAPSGITTDPRFGPLAGYGLPNPFFWHQWADDFDVVSAGYTKTTTGNGSVAPTAGNGGLALFTTNSGAPAISDVASLQLPAAGFKLEAGKKALFLARLQVSSAANAAFNVGLIQTTATPFTVADGIYFQKATGSAANLRLISVVGSAATTLVIPTNAYTLADATNIDLSWFVNAAGDILAYVGSQLVGYIPQSGTGAVNAAGVSILPSKGAVGRITAPTLTAVNLNFTLALQSGTASAKTMTVDFAMAAKER